MNSFLTNFNICGILHLVFLIIAYYILYIEKSKAYVKIFMDLNIFSFLSVYSYLCYNLVNFFISSIESVENTDVISSIISFIFLIIVSYINYKNKSFVFNKLNFFGLVGIFLLGIIVSILQINEVSYYEVNFTILVKINPIVIFGFSGVISNFIIMYDGIKFNFSENYSTSIYSFYKMFYVSLIFLFTQVIQDIFNLDSLSNINIIKVCYSLSLNLFCLISLAQIKVFLKKSRRNCKEKSETPYLPIKKVDVEMINI